MVRGASARSPLYPQENKGSEEYDMLDLGYRKLPHSAQEGSRDSRPSWPE